MKRYYDEDDEAELEGTVQRTFLPAERMQGIDWILAGVLAGVAFVGLCVFSFPGLNPDVWGEAAVGAGLRPPTEIFPGIARAVMALIYKALGQVGAGNTALMWAGRLCAACTAGGVYLLLRSLVAVLVRGRLRYAVGRYLVQRCAAFAGTFCFLCSDPVWRAGQTLSAGGMLTLFTVLAVGAFTMFLMNGRLAPALVSMFLLGGVAAESPLGILLLVVCWGGHAIALRRGALTENMPLLDPVVAQSAKWHLTFVWVLGLGLGIALNCLTFEKLGGLAALGRARGDLPILYIQCWWSTLVGAAGSLGWILGASMCVMPFAVAMVMLPRAVDDEQFLPYHVGAMFFVAGAMAYSQMAFLAPLWFWTWTDLARVESACLLQTLMCLAAATVTFALMTVGADTCCRNHVRLAMQRFAELRADEQAGRQGTRGGLSILVGVMALLIGGALPGRLMSETREIISVLEDYVREIVQESKGARWIFTDGAFDARVELAAREAGGALRALSMAAENSPYQTWLRTQGIGADAESRMALKTGAPAALRSWVRTGTNYLDQVAVQQGFEVWMWDGLGVPPCSGTVARPRGVDEATLKAGVERTEKLAERVLRLAEKGIAVSAVDWKVQELFTHLQWRLARLARLRAARADARGDGAEATRHQKLSEGLDAVNKTLLGILSEAERVHATQVRQITPREGLQLALARADFALASRCAVSILESDPDDANANFGMGMWHAAQKQWTRAEEALRKCLVRRPNEPAVWNNLAMVCLRAGRLDEAERCARKARELLPESSVVRETAREIESVRTKAAEKRKTSVP